MSNEISREVWYHDQKPASIQQISYKIDDKDNDVIVSSPSPVTYIPLSVPDQRKLADIKYSTHGQRDGHIIYDGTKSRNDGITLYIPSDHVVTSTSYSNDVHGFKPVNTYTPVLKSKRPLPEYKLVTKEIKSNRHPNLENIIIKNANVDIDIKQEKQIDKEHIQAYDAFFELDRESGKNCTVVKHAGKRDHTLPPLPKRHSRSGSVSSRITHNYYTGETICSRTRGEEVSSSKGVHTSSPYITYHAVRGRSFSLPVINSQYHLNSSGKAGVGIGGGSLGKCQAGEYRNTLQSMRCTREGMLSTKTKGGEKYGVFRYQKIEEGSVSRTFLGCCCCGCSTKCLALQIFIIFLFVLVLIFIIGFTIYLVVS